MTRPSRFRKSDLRAALAAIQDAGLHPKALDILPDGTMRWYFVEPGDSTEETLDRAFAEFDRKHGYR